MDYIATLAGGPLSGQRVRYSWPGSPWVAVELPHTSPDGLAAVARYELGVVDWETQEYFYSHVPLAI